MNRIAEQFDRLKKKGEKALIAYITAGDPDEERSLELILSACAAGIDILELGLPFSDPTADGSVIQEASFRALKQGMTLDRYFSLVRKIRSRYSSLPIVLFSYYNPLLQYGPQELYTRCRQEGIDALLVVDLPPEEATELTDHFSDPHALPLIRLIAPTTPLERKKKVAQGAEGFLYLITRTGVTGSGEFDLEQIARNAEDLRKSTTLPICLGFGISTPDDIRALAPYAEGLIVGSAVMKIVAQWGEDPSLAERVGGAVCEMKSALVGAPLSQE